MKRTKASAGVWKRLLRNAGFGVVDLSIGVACACAVAGIAVVSMNSILPGMGANQAMYQTIAQLRQGRDLAVAQRRNIQLQFLGNDQIQLVRDEEPAGTTVLSTATLEKNFQFLNFGLPDTPDAFGSALAVDFGGAATLTFMPDGTLINELGNPVNGTVFLGLANHPEVARAVTVLGATGRIRGYRWTGTKWIQ